MTPKEQYAAFCKRYPGLPVMLQPWWLEAVCAGKEWEVMLVTQSELKDEHGSSRNDTDSCPTDEVVAAMPYLLRKRLWYKFIVMPQMTMFGGVWMNDDLFASPELQERLAKVIARKLRALGVAYYYQQYPIGNPMPYWLKKRGFKVREQMLHLVTPNGQTAASTSELSAEEFYRFHSACMKEQGRNTGYAREDLLVLERKTSRADKSCFVDVRDAKGQLQAAAFLVWDTKNLYPLQWCISGENKDAEAVLIQQISSKARELGVNVLSDQSMEGKQVTSYVVWKYTNLLLAPFFYFAYRSINNPSAK